MALIKSISGIRGTIGGAEGEGLTPLDIVKFTAAYATLIAKRNPKKGEIVVGRDARLSGEMVDRLVTGTLMSMGWNVIDIGLATTPTTEMAVTMSKACGGIILTASHNPREWNALKLLNEKGEFLSAEEGKEILRLAEEGIQFAQVDEIGKITYNDSYTEKHIQSILQLPLVDAEAISKANFSVAIDCVNSVGGIAVPQLLERLGVSRVQKLFCTPNGEFPHNPEPLEKHLQDIMAEMGKGGYDVGFVVDPDVDRLAIIDERGKMFGEEYTLVSIADYVLQHTPGCTVSNLSSTKALDDVAAKHGQQRFASAVGEVNVVAEMKKQNAVIGGEGNGGVIYPVLHYGRDALVGIALFLTFLAKEKATVSQLKERYPLYHMEKMKIDLTQEVDVDELLKKVRQQYAAHKINDADGLKIEFPNGWVHLRKSNTEPIVRIYTEGTTPEDALRLGNDMKGVIERLA